MKKDTVVAFEVPAAVNREGRVKRLAEHRARKVEARDAVAAVDAVLGGFADWLTSVRIDPDAERPTSAELVYRVGNANDGVVFATPERARYVDALYDALDAKTWGEFRSRIPAAEWEHLWEGRDDGPGPDDAFDVAGVPGFFDGDWPPWLQKEILHVLPPPLVKRYAEACMTSINGVYFHIRQEDLPALLAELERRGIRAVHAPDLQFN